MGTMEADNIYCEKRSEIELLHKAIKKLPENCFKAEHRFDFLKGEKLEARLGLSLSDVCMVELFPADGEEAEKINVPNGAENVSVEKVGFLGRKTAVSFKYEGEKYRLHLTKPEKGY